MKTRYLAILATLTFLGFSVPAAAHDCADHKKQTGHCAAEPEPSGGGKALLFEIAAIQCDAPPVSVDTSFGHVTWSGNILPEEAILHVHYKLQLKRVNPEDNIPILGNQGGEWCTNNPVDFSLVNPSP